MKRDEVQWSVYMKRDALCQDFVHFQGRAIVKILLTRNVMYVIF